LAGHTFADRQSASRARLRLRGRGRADTGQSLAENLSPVAGAFRTQVGRQVVGAAKAKMEANIRIASVSGGKGLAVRALGRAVGSNRAQQIQSIVRQQARGIFRAPSVAAVGAGAVGATVITEALTGQSPIQLARDAVLNRGRSIFDTGQKQGRPQMARHQQLAVGSVLPPSHQVVKVWQTFPGGPVFARLADGHIAVQKKDGTIKHFRPYRPVVIPRNWNARSMSRVATALKRQRKTATKIMQITGGMPKGRK